MKKNLLVSLMLIWVISLSAQTTITGWTFPVNSGTDSLNATVGLSGNLGYDLRFEGTDTVYETIYFADGATDFAAAAKKWDNGADAKFWSVKFKAANYSDFKVSSKQYSDANGPASFKLQWRLSGGTFEDVPSGAVTVAGDWTTGVIDNVPVAITNQGTSSIYLRWIMSSNNSVGGGSVSEDGETRIDDILVTGLASNGVNDIVYTNRINLSPNPSNGIFNVSSTVPVKEMILTDINGRQIFLMTDCGVSTSVNIPGAAAGSYILSVKFVDNDAWYRKQIVVK